MSVYFVYRSHYDDPKLSRLKRFDEDKTVLDWFRRIWIPIDYEAADKDSHDFADELIGFSVYGFSSLFSAIHEHQLPCPETEMQLHKMLENHLYVERRLLCQPNAIQVFTDDDELDVAYYIFDDAYLSRNQHRGAFLIRDDWELPKSFREDGKFHSIESCRILQPAGGAEGFVYCAFLCEYNTGGNLEDTAPCLQISGIRLPDLTDFLLSQLLPSDKGRDSWPGEFLLLQHQMKKLSLSSSRPESNKSTLLAALTECTKLPVSLVADQIDWSNSTQDNLVFTDSGAEDYRDRQSKIQPNKSRIQVELHCVQASFHTDSWYNTDLYNRWILFDDLWAASHPNLANSILAYGNRWNVLSDPGQE